MPLRVLVSILAGGLLAACGAPEKTPVPPGLIGEARQLDLAGKQDEAIAVYRRVLATQPDSFDANYGIARALDLIGRYDEARQHFAKAIDVSPEATKDQALRMMAVSWTFVGNADRASTYYRQVFDRRLAAGSVADAADVANELGRVYLELGDPDDAEQWYRTGYETSGRLANRPAAQVDLAEMRWAHAQARIAARRGQAAEARRHEAIVKALLDKGTNDDQRIQYPYLLGYVSFYLADYPAAITELQKADPADPFILLLLAQAHEKVGKADVATNYYRKALESNSHAVNNAFARPVAKQKVGS